METEQESKWNAAQSIFISEDLLTADKLQLQFLAVVDRNRWLYQGHTLQWAIYRYNACWLPLLAKHSESKITKGPLVVPLDCEWIWHYHSLNPIRYKSDCEECMCDVSQISFKIFYSGSYQAIVVRAFYNYIFLRFQ
ncbi:unnamed protein product, partial [Lactuca virosa]